MPPSTDLAKVVEKIKKNALNFAGDSDCGRYKCRFDVPGSTGKVRRISFDAAPNAGYWVCSCPGCCSRGQCKHLTAMGLTGRKFPVDPKWIAHFKG